MKRHTYSHLAFTEHPLSKNKNIFIPKIIEPSIEDVNLAEEIIDLYQNFNNRNTTGEWKYIDTKKRHTYIKLLKEKNKYELSKLLCNFFINSSSYGIISPSLNEVKEIDKDIGLCDIDSVLEFTDLKSLEKLKKKKYSTGNPFGIDFNNKIIQFDTPRHYYYAFLILKIISKTNKKSILEIGGGYGNMIELLRNNNYNNTYFNIDLAETGLIFYYFLKKNKLKVEFLTSPISSFSNNITYIIPSEIYKLFSFGDIGLVVNFMSFSEMSKEIVDDYLTFVKNKIDPDYILHQNSNFLLFPNSDRHIEYLADDFPINDKYDLDIKMMSPFYYGKSRHRIYIYTNKLLNKN